MNDYQTAKTAALEAFSQHAKPGQKITIKGNKCLITTNKSVFDFERVALTKSKPLHQMIRIRNACNHLA